MSNAKPKILFSDHFNVDKANLEAHGAFNISLLADLPLFIDPFLLFNSEKQEYQDLHNEMIRYLRFLRDKSLEQKLTPGLLTAWYRFKEVKQNWLGFAVQGNKGSALGKDFADALNENFSRIFTNYGEEQITHGSHLEKLCLIKEGVGKDNISDFTTNLIKDYLLQYTQTFAKKYLDPKLCQDFRVSRSSFNYQTETWEEKTYFLPKFDNDFVLLTPKEILTKDETWINRLGEKSKATYEKYGVDMKLRKQSRKSIEIYQLITTSETVEKFVEIIKSYILPSMRYKLGKLR